jgi:signal transduction histidine kinase
MLKDVFRIILDNAVENDRHTGAKVVVVKGPTDDGEAVMMEFRDRGKGIPDTMKDKVFKRLDGEKWSVSGSGLSLAVVQTFLMGIGGSVRVEDRVAGDPTQGANFVLVLPRAAIDRTG